MSRPSVPKGTRDFSPAEMTGRNYIFDTIRQVFQRFGYQQIETPAMENLSTLLGKYGEEGDKLLFKILNSGPVIDEIKNRFGDIRLGDISEKGLRYDLTVPFARYVVMHRNEITFPFKRFQIQPVWRADRPQKGRYREFYQCDADVIGSDSLLNELELIQIIDAVFNLLDIDVVIRLNNRKILSGITEITGASDKFTDITVAIDKLDKTGKENVIEELKLKGLTENSISSILDIISLKGSMKTKIIEIRKHFTGTEEGMKGIAEMETLMGFLEQNRLKSEVELDLTLARGLNYYTGTIIEVKAKDAEIGSVCGGGRYDDLTGIFGLPGISGVGISFGADRIFDVLQEKNKFPYGTVHSSRVMFANLGADELKAVFPILEKLREQGICSELYPENDKLKKQFSWADARGIPFVAIIGSNELQTGLVTLKNMKSGEQKSIYPDEIATAVS